MTAWCHQPTILDMRRVFKDRRKTFQFIGIISLCVALITTLFLSVLFASPSHAAPGINQTIGFQGRLLDSEGDMVPDGYYNMQFKIYEGGTGTAAGNPGGTLKWTENYINNGSATGAVEVKNGFMSVNLGSRTAFGTSIDWNQDTLWLSMNIAGRATACTTFGTSPCTADGEMLPMKRLTATPYSLNSARLNGKTEADFIHNSTDEQTGNFNINGNGIASTLQGNTSVISPLFDRADAGTLSIGTATATTIDIGSASTDQTINIGTGAANKDVAVGSDFGTSGTLIQGGTQGVQISTNGGFSVATIENGLNSLEINELGNIAMNLGTANSFTIKNGTDDLFEVQEDGLIRVGSSSALTVEGTATFSGGVAIQGSGLDVDGEVNSTQNYRINGVSTLSSSDLTFSGGTPSTVTSADTQALNLNGKDGVAIQNNGTNVATFDSDKIRIGGGSATDEPTLLTVDRADSTPIVTGSDVLGSMYYDTTLGKVQCYEADGWGSCSSSPDIYVSLSPEYANGVVQGSTLGTFASAFCSDTLNINDGSSGQPGYCNANETRNLYDWHSSESTAQVKNIFVTYQLPANFKRFISGTTKLEAARAGSPQSSVQYQAYRSNSSGLTACGSATSMTVTGAWEILNATGSADPANCSFAAGDSIVFRISMSSSQNHGTAVSTLGFAYSDD